jgi:spore maturation protein CgeB
VGKWPLPDGPKSHVVSYNYEALRAGALLMSEETLPLNDVFIDGLEYLSFKNYNDLVEKITFFLQNEVLAEQIASAGNRKYIELIEKQAILNSVIDRM